MEGRVLSAALYLIFISGFGVDRTDNCFILYSMIVNTGFPSDLPIQRRSREIEVRITT
jgi:hypothetical protein